MGGLALWKLQILVALLLSAVTIATAMRPGVDALPTTESHARVGFHFTTSSSSVSPGSLLSFVAPRARWLGGDPHAYVVLTLRL